METPIILLQDFFIYDAIMNGGCSMFRRFNVPKVLYSEGSMFRMFYVPNVLCSEGSMFRRFYDPKVLCSEYPLPTAGTSLYSEGSIVRRFDSPKCFTFQRFDGPKGDCPM